MEGTDLLTIKELMGHKTIAMTCRYAHLAPSRKQAAVEQLVSPTDTATDTDANSGVGPQPVAVQ